MVVQEAADSHKMEQIEIYMIFYYNITLKYYTLIDLPFKKVSLF